jgi:hypothetical protein
LLSELKLLAFPYRKPHTAGSTSDTLKIVQPETVIRWYRADFRILLALEITTARRPVRRKS